MFALYGLGKGKVKAIKKSGTSFKKAILPTKKTSKPKPKTAVPLVKVVSKKPLSPKGTSKATSKAGAVTAKKAGANLALKKGTTKTSFLPTKKIKQKATDKIKEIAKKTQPSIFPDTTSNYPVQTSYPGSDPVPYTPSNYSSSYAQSNKMSQSKIIGIAAGLGLLTLIIMGKKGR